MFHELVQTRDRADGIVASNVGGYHSERDLFSDARSKIFHDFLVECIARAEAWDEPFRDVDGAASTSELRAPTEAWLNASQKEALNLLHHHSDATWSGAYYVDDGRGDAPGFLGGQLLLRLTPGGGHGSCEPDEMEHVPRMALRGVYATVEECQYQYVEVRPEPGTLVLFPSWLSHAVAPHFGNAERISVSFNVSLKNALKGDHQHCIPAEESCCEVVSEGHRTDGSEAGVDDRSDYDDEQMPSFEEVEAAPFGVRLI
jgi:hypothetical protein